ncbi:zinc finger, CCHC-type containing protein [Tanacetum coccineum]
MVMMLSWVKLGKRAKWDNDDFVCRGLILNDMSNYLFDIYQSVESSKELWDPLKAKYMAEDASSKKLFVSCIIDKLLSSWKDFKHTLKHNKEELTLVELGSHLRIEESLGAQDSDKPKGNNVVGPQLNIVNDNIALAFMSTSKLNDSIVWHARLSHVYFNRMQDMSKDGLIPAFDMDTKKCERGIECIFVGYAKHSKAFRFYVIEPRFSSVPRPSLRIPNGTEDIGGSVVPEEVTEEDEVSDQHYYCFNVEDDPKTFDEAMKSQDVFLLGGVAIYWASKKQTCINGSTMESKFVALVGVSKEAEWLRNQILDIPLWSKPIALISIRCDSAATLAKAYSQIYNRESRHLGVRYGYIKNHKKTVKNRQARTRESE